MKLNWMDYCYKPSHLRNSDACRDLNEIKGLDESKKSAAHIAFKAKYAQDFAIARSQQEENTSNFVWLVENLNKENRSLVIPALRSYHGQRGYYITKDPGTGILDFKMNYADALNVYNLCEGVSV